MPQYREVTTRRVTLPNGVQFQVAAAPAADGDDVEALIPPAQAQRIARQRELALARRKQREATTAKPAAAAAVAPRPGQLSLAPMAAAAAGGTAASTAEGRAGGILERSLFSARLPENLHEDFLAATGFTAPEEIQMCSKEDLIEVLQDIGLTKQKAKAVAMEFITPTTEPKCISMARRTRSNSTSAVDAPAAAAGGAAASTAPALDAYYYPDEMRPGEWQGPFKKEQLAAWFMRGYFDDAELVRHGLHGANLTFSHLCHPELHGASEPVAATRAGAGADAAAEAIEPHTDPSREPCIKSAEEIGLEHDDPHVAASCDSRCESGAAIVTPQFSQRTPPHPPPHTHTYTLTLIPHPYTHTTTSGTNLDVPYTFP